MFLIFSFACLSMSARDQRAAETSQMLHSLWFGAINNFALMSVRLDFWPHLQAGTPCEFLSVNEARHGQF